MFDKSWKAQADQLNRRIFLQKGHQKDEQTIPLAEQLYHLTGQHMKEDPQRYLDALDTLSGLYAKMGEYAKAEPLYQISWKVHHILGTIPDLLARTANSH